MWPHSFVKRMKLISWNTEVEQWLLGSGKDERKKQNKTKQKVRKPVLVAFQSLWRDAMIKATYKIKHLIGHLSSGSEGEPGTTMAGSTATGKRAWH